MEQFITTLVIILAGAFIAACFTGKFKRKDCYINLEPLQRFEALCRLAPCPLQEAAEGQDAEELFFCSSASALALTSRRLLLWVRDGKGYQLISLPINRFQAHLLSGDFSVPQDWPEIPDFILDHTGPKPLAPLYITTHPDASDFPIQIVAIAQEDYPDFDFWYGYAESLNWRA